MSDIRRPIVGKLSWSLHGCCLAVPCQSGKNEVPRRQSEFRRHCEGSPRHGAAGRSSTRSWRTRHGCNGDERSRGGRMACLCTCPCTVSRIARSASSSKNLMAAKRLGAGRGAAALKVKGQASPTSRLSSNRMSASGNCVASQHVLTDPHPMSTTSRSGFGWQRIATGRPPFNVSVTCSSALMFAPRAHEAHVETVASLPRMRESESSTTGTGFSSSSQLV